MKPDWDKLMEEFAGRDTQLVGDVDCTAEGKPICDSNDVKGFPTIKYGDPADLQDYQGGRDFFPQGLRGREPQAHVRPCPH